MNNIFRRNLSLKLISIFFALILWSFVIGETNPLRLRTVSNIPVHFMNENALKSQKLILKDDQRTKDSRVKVTVEVRQKEISSFNEDNVDATLDLSTIKESGKKIRVKVEAKSSVGKVYKVSPAFIELDVDPLVERTVPVAARVTGNLPNGYWRGNLQTTPSVISLTGAKSDVDKIQQALLWVPLDNVTNSLENTFPVIFAGEDGKEVKGNYSASASSIIVRMPVFPEKTVTVNVGQEAILQGITGGTPITGEPAKGYEIKSIEVNPPSVMIAGDEALIKGIQQIGTESIDIQNAAADVTKVVKLTPPKGIELVDREEVEVVIRIGMKDEQKTLEIQGIQGKNLSSGLSVSKNINTAKVVVQGPISIIKDLSAENIALYLDLSGAKKGSQQVPVKVQLPNGVQLVSITPDKIAVKIE